MKSNSIKKILDNHSIKNYLFNKYSKKKSNQYASKINWDRVFDQLILTAKLLPKNAKVLEVGSGYGHYLVMLKDIRKDINIIGTDYMLHDLWKKITKQGYDIRQMDALDLKFKDESFDAIISYGVMEHVNDDEKFMMEMNRVLKDGGKMLMFNLPNKLSLTEFIARKLKMHHHDNLYTKKTIKKLYSKYGFKINKIGLNYIIPGQFNYISVVLNRLLDKFANLVNILDKILCKTHIKTFAQSFYIISKKLKDNF